ncbi:MAG TPA: hypothetical protein VIL98_03130 [Gaiellaceae bacterium]
MGLLAGRARGRRGDRGAGAEGDRDRGARVRSQARGPWRIAGEDARTDRDGRRCSRAAGVRVAFFGVDGSRADVEYLDDVYRAAIAAGAAEVVVVDTLGIAAPEAAGYLVARIADVVGPDVPVHFHGHDDFGLATAGAIAAVNAGATWLHGTINGMGERAGNANLPEVAFALEAVYGYRTNLKLEETVRVSQRVREISGYDLAPWTPLIGENLFRRETGAVAAQFHDPPAVEPYSSLLVGAERGIVLGKKSGIDSIRIKGEELGLVLPEDAQRELLTAVKARGVEKHGLVSDDEFRALAATVVAETARS